MKCIAERGIPRVHQKLQERQLLVTVAEHVAYMIELGYFVAVGIVDTVVDDPVLAVSRICVRAIDHTDTLIKSRALPLY
jgi:hypothetical protein